MLARYDASDITGFTNESKKPMVPKQHQQAIFEFGEEKRLEMTLANDGIAAAVDLIKNRLAKAAQRQAAGVY